MHIGAWNNLNAKYVNMTKEVEVLTVKAISILLRVTGDLLGFLDLTGQGK